MKTKFLFSLFLGTALGLSAQGFKDGVEYYRADQPEEALMILTNTLNQPGTDQATAYYYLGQIDLGNGNTAAAKANFEKGLAANPDNGYNYVGMGSLALAAGNTSEAQNYFKEAKSKGKKNVDVLTEIARAYFVADHVKYAKEIDKAMADAKKAGKNAPAPFILEGDMIMASDGVSSTKAGDAAGRYEMAANFDTNNEHPEAYVKYARTYFPVNARYAIDKLQELLNKQPNSALAQRELAEKYYENNQLTRAAEEYGKYIQNPNHFKADEQRYVGLLYFGKKYQESYDLAGKLLAEDPTNFYMQRMQFYNLKALENNDQALAAAEKLLANPKTVATPNDYTMYGELLNDMGRDTLAVEMYQKAVEIAPEKLSLLKDLSSAYNQAKMYEKSAQAQQEFVDKTGAEVDPNDLFTLARRYNTLAYVDLETDSVASRAAADKGLEVINQVLANENVKENPLVLNTKSDILRYRNGNKVNQEVIDADMVTLGVLDSDPANLEKRKSIYRSIYSRLGNYYLVNKDMENALLYFNKFYEIDPSPELKAFIEGLAQ